MIFFFFFFSSRRRHTRSLCDWSSDVCSSDLPVSHETKKKNSMKFCKTLGFTQSQDVHDTVVTHTWRTSLRPINLLVSLQGIRSEERRVGKECRYCVWRYN